MRNFRKFIAVFLCFGIVMLCSCNNKNDISDDDKTKTAYGFEFPTELDFGVTVEDCYLYSGEYVEDGSFESCENVVAIKVKNVSGSDIQLLRIKATTDSKELFFEISTLSSDNTVVVLEKSKQSLSENEKILSFQRDSRVDFEENISLCEDVFVVQGNLSTINIQNISDTDIESDFYVYYKKKDADGNYFGGVTFRTKVEGGLKATQIKQMSAVNFDPSDSEVLFIDYAN